MIHSMTAFARTEAVGGSLTVSCELRSYNSRHLDVVLRLPHGYAALEERIKARISERLARGRVEVAVKIRDEAEENYVVEVNEPAARAFHRALESLRSAFDLKSPVSLEMLAAAPGVIRPADTERDPDACWEVLGPTLSAALDELEAMRRREGDFIAEDFESRLAGIEAALDRIADGAADLVPLYRDRLRERLAALTQGVTAIDPDRIAQEAAILADRSDVTEELTRARSHVQQFRFIIAAEEPGGRKLNFLIQELNREFNTIGSKIARSDIAHRVVEVKAELEKIREQVQNVE